MKLPSRGLGLGTGLVAIGVGAVAEAGITVSSSKLSTGTGHHIVFKNPVSIDDAPTTYVDTPFPNDASNSLTANANELHVLTNRTGSHFIFGQQSNQFTSRDTWTIEKFEVNFLVDAPTPFTFSHASPNNPFPIHIDLIKDGATNLIPQLGIAGPVTSLAGVLDPGSYTFTGYAGIEGVIPPSPM